MIATAVFELVKQFCARPNAANAALALISLSRQNKCNFSDKVNYRQTQS